MEELGGLPVPQLRALQVALLRSEPAGVSAEPHAIAVGFLNALRALAAGAPLLVAVDDVQWLDSPSAEVLDFAARRLEGDEIRFLLARRPGSPSALERSLERRRLERLEVGPLSLGAMRRLLRERLGLSMGRQLLRRIVDATQGNPLFALELGRTLADGRLPAVGEEIPVPDAVEDLLGTRVARLPEAVRRLLLAVALSGDLRDVPARDDRGPGRCRRRRRNRAVARRGRPRARVASLARRRGEETLASTRAARAPPRTCKRRRRRGAAGPSPGSCDGAPGFGARGYRGRRGRRRGRPRRGAGGRDAGRARATPDHAGLGRAQRSAARARRLLGGRRRAATGHGSSLAGARFAPSGHCARARLPAPARAPRSRATTTTCGSTSSGRWARAGTTPGCGRPYSPRSRSTTPSLSSSGFARRRPARGRR